VALIWWGRLRLLLYLGSWTGEALQNVICQTRSICACLGEVRSSVPFTPCAACRACSLASMQQLGCGACEGLLLLTQSWYAHTASPSSPPTCSVLLVPHPHAQVLCAASQHQGAAQYTGWPAPPRYKCEVRQHRYLLLLQIHHHRWAFWRVSQYQQAS
jgi:hypothetical protein